MGLERSLQTSDCVSTATLSWIKDMNCIKKGLADAPLDFDKVLSAIKNVTEIGQAKEPLKPLEVNALTYNILHLLKSEEFSVRDYASHALAHLLPLLDEKVFRLCELQIIDYTKLIHDELILKSILAAFKTLIQQAVAKDFQNTVSFSLQPLLFSNQGDDGFFTQILSMQMAHRSKALRKLATLDSIPAAPFRQAVLPLVDFLIFNTRSHMQNRRNTVRYSREQSGQLLEDALNVYVTYAKRLRWTECFKLIRKLLFKIEKATRRSAELSAEKEDMEMEKTVTKCLCKVLDGLAQSSMISLPDAVDAIAERAKQAEQASKKRVNEFSALVQEIVTASKTDQELNDGAGLTDESDSEQSEDDEVIGDRKDKASVEMMAADQVRDV